MWECESSHPQCVSAEAVLNKAGFKVCVRGTAALTLLDVLLGCLTLREKATVLVACPVSLKNAKL
ncbi:hypothetical protein JI62_21235 [Halomonas campaniensis]|uniref:Uncharacterized protein n=1 Tax=Halomonas campaniensis TaxID=213554 RepID=A0A246RUP5_9GAMM|nr:hypothetical protein JI62_21235 [Halomonas campaniensis]